MYEIDITGLQRLLESGRQAARFAWDHYEELVARKQTNTLYGPDAYYIGASIPSALTPERARKLMHSTRRKNHMVYHLDENCKVIRTIGVRNYTEIECLYHHFELNGITYAYPFRGNNKSMFTDEVNALAFENDKPVFFGLLSKNFVFAQFYEYISAEKMLVSTYRYSPEAKFSLYGYPVDPKAPVGALNSVVDRHCREEVPGDTDFSRWIRSQKI